MDTRLGMLDFNATRGTNLGQDFAEFVAQNLYRINRANLVKKEG